MNCEPKSQALYAFADEIGVKHGTIKRWRHEGMPSHEACGSIFVVPSEALGWIKTHARPSTFSKSSFVYFASKGDAIKIGSSVDPTDRLRSLHVEILATVHGDKRTELAFHALFAGAAIGNEWFRPVPELLSLIDSLKAA